MDARKFVEKELIKLRKNLNKVKTWKAEIQVLESKINAYKNGGFGLSISSNIVTLDDILARNETRLNTLKSNIEYTDYKLNEYRAYLMLLADDEKKIIEKRYLDETNKNTSFELLAKEMLLSKTSIKRKHDLAINKISEYKDGNVENSDVVRIRYELGTN